MSKQTWKKSLQTHHDPRSLATTLYRKGKKVCPLNPFSISGNLSSSGFGRNSNFWTIEVKNKKNSIFANCSPRQCLGPTENGITCFDLTKFPSLSKCLSGLNSFGSSQILGSLWTAHKFGATYNCTKNSVNVKKILGSLIYDMRKMQISGHWNSVSRRSCRFLLTIHISRKAVCATFISIYNHFWEIPIIVKFTTACFIQIARPAQLSATMTLSCETRVRCSYWQQTDLAGKRVTEYISNLLTV